MTRPRILAPLALAALGIAACGDGDPSASEASAASGPAGSIASSGTDRPATTTTPASGDATSTIDTEGAPPASSTSSTTSTSTSAPTTTPAPATTVPAGLDSTLVAIDGAGDAVAFTDGTEAPPILLFDGPDPDDPPPAEGPGENVADGIALTPSGDVAYVGTCCEPIGGAILVTAPPTPAMFGDAPPLVGYAPAVSPDGRLLAAGQIALGVVSIRDLETDELLDVPEPDASAGTYSPYDTMWLDDRRLASLGILGGPSGSTWVMYPIEIADDGVTVGDPIDLSGRFGPAADALLRFAGRVGDDRVAIHRRGDASVSSVPFDGVPAADESVFDASGPALTIWVEPGQPPIVVTEDRALFVGDQQVPGDYLWART